MNFPHGTILLQTGGDLPDAFPVGWLLFADPEEVIEVKGGGSREGGRVRDALGKISGALNKGKWGAGFIAYEAAPAFDAALEVKEPVGGTPLIWFGIYREPQHFSVLPQPAGKASEDVEVLDWRAAISEAEYAARHARVREYIAAGDTYQVNLTYLLRSPCKCDPYEFFYALHAAQRPKYGAYIRGEDFAIASASPELFFAQNGERVLTRPMKGTAPRGRWLEEDRARAEDLHSSPKERAENLMIVDLLRNDLGRVARPGSVRVESLYYVERYPTVWQMTSAIAGQTDAEPLDVLAALFPCGSVTGAPKIRTMEIIAELESSPRGVYCGAIGCIGPGRRAQFNVAIRTVWCDLRQGQATYGVGGGITWDSTSGAELVESQVKARILTAPLQKSSREFKLLETILWEPDRGCYLLEGHLLRLADSAEYFGFLCDADSIRRNLLERAKTYAAVPQRVRLLLARDGSFQIEHELLKGPMGAEDHAAAKLLTARRISISPARVHPENVMLFHKTSERRFYDDALSAARASEPRAEDILLLNTRGEITESSAANVVVEIGGRLLTPARECGLLNGVFRQKLIAEGLLAEAHLTLDDVSRATGRWLISSVRRWLPFKVLE